MLKNILYAEIKDWLRPSSKQIIDVIAEKLQQFYFLKNSSEVRLLLGHMKLLEDLLHLNYKRSILQEVIDDFIGKVIVPIGWIASIFALFDFLASIKKRVEGKKEILDICDEYETIPLMYTLDQLTDKALSSHGLNDDNLSEKERHEYKSRMKNIISDVFRFYVQNRTVTEENVIKHKEYIFDDPGDKIDLLAVNKINDKEQFKRKKALFNLPSKTVETIDKYKEDKPNLSTELRLMICLCGKINFSDLKKRNKKKEEMVDEVLKLPEVSPSQSKSKAHHKYFHYKFEDKEGLVEGDISLTSLQDMVTYL